MSDNTFAVYTEHEYEQLHTQLEDADMHFDEVRIQLAAAQAAIVKHNVKVDEDRKDGFEYACYAIDLDDTAALDAAIATARIAQAHDDKKHWEAKMVAATKPIVTALKKISDNPDIESWIRCIADEALLIKP